MTGLASVDRSGAADRTLIAALAAGATQAAAATAAGMSERTVRRRLTDPIFAARVSAERTDLVATVTGRLIGAATAAVQTLEDVLAAKGTGVRQLSVRTRAAAVILAETRTWSAAQDLEDRIARLEDQLATRHDRPRLA